MDKIRLKNNADQNPLTEKPSTSLPAKIMMTAFITSKKSPNVTTVIGMVSMVNIGFTMVFKKANTTATNNAVK